MTVQNLEENISLTKLMEGELERAEIILAARDVLQRIQKMTEDIAKINTEDIMPLIDNIKGVFGPEAGDRFEQASRESIDNAVQALRDCKDSLNTQVLHMEGKITDADLTDMGQMDGGQGATGTPELGPEANAETPAPAATQEAPPADPFAGTDAASGPADEPLGRAKKESVEGGEAIVETRIVEVNKPVPGLEGLVTWILGESETRMRPTQFLNFTRKLAVHAARDPRGLTEWLNRKKNNALQESQIVREYFEGEVHTNMRNLEGNDPKGAKLAGQIYGAIKAANIPDEEKEGWTNVLSHCCAYHDDASIWQDPEEKYERTVRAVRLDPAGGSEDGKKIANGLKKLVYHFHMKHDVDESIVGAELEEAKIHKIDELEAQAIWAEPNVDRKKQLAFAVVDKFVASKESKALEKGKIAAMRSSNQIDRWVANMALHGDGLGMGMGRQTTPINAGLEVDGSTVAEDAPLSPQDKKKAQDALNKVAQTVAKDPNAKNQTVDQVSKDLDNDEKNALKKVGATIKSKTGSATTKAGDFVKDANLAVGESKDEDEDKEQVDENVLFLNTNAKVGDYGQHQGEPFSTDYGKYKVTGGVSNSGTGNKGKSTAKAGGKSGEAKPISDAGSVTTTDKGQVKGNAMSTDNGANKANQNKPSASSTAKTEPLKPGSSTPLAQQDGGKKEKTEESLSVKYSRGAGPVRTKTFESSEARDQWIAEANGSGLFKIVE